LIAIIELIALTRTTLRPTVGFGRFPIFRLSSLSLARPAAAVAGLLFQGRQKAATCNRGMSVPMAGMAGGRPVTAAFDP